MKVNMKSAEETFEKYREYLKAEVVRLVCYIKLYRRINERMKDRSSEINIARSFFQVTLDALFSAIILWVDKLLGARSERGFVDFLSFIENNRGIFEVSELKRRRNYPDGHWMLSRKAITSEVIKKHRDQISKIESLPHFKLRRDKFHAHFDKKYFFNREKLDDDAPLRWSDLENVIEVMREILNHYSAAYDGMTYRLEPLNIHDIDNLLDMLYRCRQRQEKEQLNGRF